MVGGSFRDGHPLLHADGKPTSGMTQLYMQLQLMFGMHSKQDAQGDETGSSSMCRFVCSTDEEACSACHGSNDSHLQYDEMTRCKR